MWVDDFYYNIAKRIGAGLENHGIKPKTFWGVLGFYAESFQQVLAESAEQGELTEPQRLLDVLNTPLSIALADPTLPAPEARSFQPSTGVCEAALSLSDKSSVVDWGHVLKTTEGAACLYIDLTKVRGLSMMFAGQNDKADLTITPMAAIVWAGGGLEIVVPVTMAGKGVSNQGFYYYRWGDNESEAESSYITVAAENWAVIEDEGLPEFDIEHHKVGVTLGGAPRVGINGFIGCLADICMNTPTNVEVVTKAPPEGYFKGVRTKHVKKRLKRLSIFKTETVNFTRSSGYRDSSKERRKIEHRYQVRGFWRMQKVGAGRKQQKLVYVRPHIRGRGTLVQKIDNKVVDLPGERHAS